MMISLSIGLSAGIRKLVSGGGGAPSLDFSISTNSQYLGGVF